MTILLLCQIQKELLIFQFGQPVTSQGAAAASTGLTTSLGFYNDIMIIYPILSGPLSALTRGAITDVPYLYHEQPEEAALRRLTLSCPEAGPHRCVKDRESIQTALLGKLNKGGKDSAKY